jgi:acyl transferase domain-containing protein/NADPH:quinone reductase-like Zn-dependent oxidoreductase/SAM-dependent methyltransferase/acyl carrier protein
MTRIAIIGAACRLPGAVGTPEEFWSLLTDGPDPIGEVPPDRLDIASVYHPDPARSGKMYTKAGGFLPRIDGMDAEFFGISPREAEQIDPQQRLLLELAIEALDNAGVPRDRIAGTRAGVFIGISATDYHVIQSGDLSATSAYTNAGGALSIAANRLSYVLDLHGPSMAIDTACSSSLVAMHLAVESLRRGESDCALVGGVNVLLSPAAYVGFAKASMLSPTGRCRSFDAGADGYVRSEGGVVLMLKPLDQARLDGDRILGCIRASEINSDGRTNGLSLPNGVAQASLLETVYKSGGIAPDDVCYIEAHGTGTPAGDPIECDAIGRVLGQSRHAHLPLPIGSVKSNVGHLEPASGLVGVLKCLLALQHGTIPANRHYTRPNPAIDLPALNLRVVDSPLSLPRNGKPAIMGVNSFGFGGTNAHVVLEEHVASDTPPKVVRGNDVLLLSGASRAALTARAAQFADHLASRPTAEWPRICATAAHRRTAYAHRLALHADGPAAAAARLRDFAAGAEPSGAVSGRTAAGVGKVALVLSGNGSQWPGMGRALLADDPVFRKIIERIDRSLACRGGPSVASIIADGVALDRTDLAQPALFAIQAGLIESLRAQGLLFDAVVGHSVGEVAAAWCAGALDLDQAVRVICARSAAQHACAGLGRMAAVALSLGAVRAEIEAVGGWIEIAGENSRESVTLAGDPISLETLVDRVAARGIFATMLDLNYAFHSRSMDPIRGDLLADLEGLAPAAGAVRFVSTVTGDMIDGRDLDAGYWWRNIRQPVQFRRAINRLLATGHGTFLEIAPHPILGRYVQECAKDVQLEPVVLSSLRRNADEIALRNEIVPRLFVAGARLDLARLVPDAGNAALPPYPWQRSRFWTPARRRARPDRSVAGTDHPLLGRRTPGPDAAWAHELDLHTQAYLADHRVGDVVLFPAAGFVEVMLAAGHSALRAGGIELEHVAISQPLMLSQTDAVELNTSVSLDDGSIAIRSHDAQRADGWLEHARGRAVAIGAAGSLGRIEIARLRARLPGFCGSGDIYAALALRGLAYGPAFQTMADASIGPGEVLARLRTPTASPAAGAEYLLHPASLDGCFQAMLTIPAVAATNARLAYLPVSLRRLRVSTPGAQIAYCWARLRNISASSISCDLALMDASGVIVAEVTELRARRVELTRDLRAHLQFAETVHVTIARPDDPPIALPTPDVLRNEIEPRLERWIAEFSRARAYADIGPRIDRLCAAYAAHALRTLCGGQQRFTIDDIATSRILPDQLRLVPRLLDMVTQDGLAKPDGDGWTWQAGSDRTDADAIWRDLIQCAPDHLAELLIVARAGERLQAFLEGASDPVEMLSGSGSTALDGLYDSAPFSRIYNEIIAAAIGRVIVAVPTTRRLRLLEIGGGTGGLTSRLLEILPRDRVDYVFTDVSEAFLSRAETRFGARSDLTFQVLDIARDPLDQGFRAASFDIVVAANVLHMTPLIDETLANVHTLLRPGGLLAMMETQPRRFLDIVFGTLDDWWAFAGDPRRSYHALLDPSDWLSALGEAGMPDGAVVHDAPHGSVPVNVVILARRPEEKRAPLTANGAGKHFLLLVEEGDSVGARLARGLVKQGHTVARVLPGDGYAATSADTYHAAPADASDMARVLRALANTGRAPDGIVALWGSDLTVEPMAIQQRQGMTAAALLTAMSHEDVPTHLRLTLCSRNGEPVGDGQVAAAQGALGALGRVAINEFPERKIRLLNLHEPEHIPDAALLREVVLASEDSEVTLTRDGRLVPRLRKLAPQTVFARGLPFVVAQRQAGNLESLFLRASAPVPPGSDEVQIAVRAVALNFRDLAVAGSLLPEEAFEAGFIGLRLGLEVAGVVSAVGDAVSGLAVGDHVVGFASGALASHVVAKADFVGPMPPGIGFEEAAGLPCVFVTLLYAIEEQARLGPGDTMLVHSAAGGIGLAAIQIAARLGIEVIATAGDPEKRAFLRRLGVKHIFDSRSLTFADDVLAATGGQGVDAVLNSLAGEALTRSLAVLKPFGRFIELGKRDFFANSRIGLRPFGDNISFYGIDVDQLLALRRDLCRRLLRRLLSIVEAGQAAPIPFRAFPVARVAEALRTMQRGQHIGKLVITFDDEELHIERDAPALAIDPNGMYVVTGGLGGFGLATAEWLAANGARRLLLIGRSGAATPQARQAVDRLRASGVAVSVAATDVADRDALASALSRARENGTRIAGVVHAAMVLDDASILALTPERFDAVMRPKLLGAWHLHQLTRDDALDFFVLYSSAATCFGNPGQANYVAANGFLEALAWHRQRLGLPALAVAWGAIAQVGFVSRNEALGEALATRFGLNSMPPDVALAALGRLIVEGRTCAVVSDIDWSLMPGRLPLASGGRFDEINEARAPRSATDTGNLRNLLAGLPREEGLAIVRETLREELGRILRMPLDRIEEDQVLSALGLDSLMVVELQVALERIGASIPAMRMINTTVRALAAQLVDTIGGFTEPRGDKEDDEDGDDAPETHAWSGSAAVAVAK